jgi:hypothetical protein
MTSHFQDLAFKNFKINTTESFQYGPFCIHENYRGTGLIKAVFEFEKRWLRGFRWDLPLST